MLLALKAFGKLNSPKQSSVFCLLMVINAIDWQIWLALNQVIISNGLHAVQEPCQGATGLQMRGPAGSRKKGGVG